MNICIFGCPDDRTVYRIEGGLRASHGSSREATADFDIDVALLLDADGNLTTLPDEVQKWFIDAHYYQHPEMLTHKGNELL